MVGSVVLTRQMSCGWFGNWAAHAPKLVGRMWNEPAAVVRARVPCRMVPFAVGVLSAGHSPRVLRVSAPVLPAKGVPSKKGRRSAVAV